MNIARRSVAAVAVLLALLGVIPPIVLHWFVLGRVPSVTPEEAKAILAEPATDAVLVDVRTPEEYAADHLDAAHPWPDDAIAAVKTADDIPAELRGRRLLLICQSGIRSALATQHLRSLGIADALNVEGGMQAWVASAEKPCALGLCRLRTADGATRGLPLRESRPLEQWTAVLTGFVIKPTYTVIALILAVILWRQRSPDLVALRWAMLCFFVGENFCAANYLVYGEQSVLFEYLHCYGMVLCFGLTIFALLEGLDRRLLKLSDTDARCAALGLCHRCIKHADVPCGLQRVFLFLIPAAAIVALAPLCAPLVPVSYNTTILGSFYNYSHAVVHQAFEQRYLPLAAVVLFGVALALLCCKRRDAVLWSKVFFAAAAGAMGFSFFRLILFHVYRDNLVWFAAWEEVTEFLFVLGIVLVLSVFRESLFGAAALPRDKRGNARGLVGESQ